jgi:cytochrome c peroxidase
MPGCIFSGREWEILRSLASAPEAPPPDPSNRYYNSPDAGWLGQQFYFDPRFSGTATLVDTLGRQTQYARADKGEPTNISCSTCHDPKRAGGDFTSIPGHVSIGAGWYDVHAQRTVNAAYYDLFYWNGRNDSLWSQIAAVTESNVSMASGRLKVAWVINDFYRSPYSTLFNIDPIPRLALSAKSTDLVPYVEPAILDGGIPNPLAGQCKLVSGVCPSSTPIACRQVPVLCRPDGGPPSCTSQATSCWPSPPLQGKPGSTAGCQASIRLADGGISPGDTSEPFGDAFDCMPAGGQDDITLTYVNFAKAIEAYEYKLISRSSKFDKFVDAGPVSEEISPAAKRGAKLFVGKASCVECHNTFLFSDNDFHNVGVAQIGAGVPTEADCPAGSAACDCVNGPNCFPWGVREGVRRLDNVNKFNRDSKWSDCSPLLDGGVDGGCNGPAEQRRQALASRMEAGDDLKGAWRTPGLRDVALTPPYMHDGAIRTLEEVVWWYNLGGASAGFAGQKSVKIKPLHLTDQDISDLVEFLATLTGEPLDHSLVSDPPERPR